MSTFELVARRSIAVGTSRSIDVRTIDSLIDLTRSWDKRINIHLTDLLCSENIWLGLLFTVRISPIPEVITLSAYRKYTTSWRMFLHKDAFCHDNNNIRPQGRFFFFFLKAELYPVAHDLWPIANPMDTKAHSTAHSPKVWGLDYDSHVQMKSIITNNARCVMVNFCSSWLINQIHLFGKLSSWVEWLLWSKMTVWLNNPKNHIGFVNLQFS